MINLTLSNLTEQQVIDILSELVSLPNLSKITALRMQNRNMKASEVIELLVAACGKHNPVLN